MDVIQKRYWDDNQVSCTVQFDSETESTLLSKILDEYQYKLKGISFLPKFDPNKTKYAQLPYEEISREKYEELVKKIKVLDNDKGQQDPKSEDFCDNEVCLV